MVQAVDFGSGCNLREAADFVPGELHKPRNHKTWIAEIRASRQGKGNRLLADQRLEKIFSIAVAIFVPGSAKELGMAWRGGS